MLTVASYCSVSVTDEKERQEYYYVSLYRATLYDEFAQRPKTENQIHCNFLQRDITSKALKLGIVRTGLAQT
jgi:hypothetical protein